MDSDVKPMPELSPRAGVARMALELRSLMQEIEALEAQDTPVDVIGARRQLRGRLDPMMDERRDAHRQELDAARADAERAIAAAHREAGVIRARRRPSLDVRLAQLLEPVPVEDPVSAEALPEADPQDDALSAASDAQDDAVAEPQPESGVVEPALLRIVPPLAVDAATETVEVVETRENAVASDDRPLPVTAAASPLSVTIDADAFARVFATVVAAMMQQRDPGQWVPYTPPQPEARRASFWSHARHPDVLLLGVATAIVLVVLVAWLG